MRFGCDQSAQDAHAAITDREDIDPAGHGATGRPEAPCQRGGVGPQVPGPILLEREVRWGAIQKLLSPVAQRLPAYNFSFWIDKRDVFYKCSLDGRPSAFGVPLGKDLVQVAVKQLLRVWHAIKSSRRDPAAIGVRQQHGLSV